MSFKYKMIIGFFTVCLFLFSGCGNKNDEHIHKYEENKTYYLTNDGNDYYTQKCTNGGELKIVEAKETYILNNLLYSMTTGDKVIIERDINKTSTSPSTYIVRSGITIEGRGENKPKIYGNFRIHLEDNELIPVTIKNLEIIHNGTLQYDSNTKPMLGMDERRGILVVNGGVQLENNYIHLLDENPTQRLHNASTGIQISVSDNNEYKEQYTYVINNNRIGKYARSQTTSSSVPVGILLDNDIDAKLNITLDDAKEIYDNNSFDNGTECYLAAYDYEDNKYKAGYFSTLEIAQAYLGSDYEYLNNNLEIVNDNNVYQTIIKQ